MRILSEIATLQAILTATLAGVVIAYCCAAIASV